MLKRAFIILACCLELAYAAPLRFYIRPSEGLATWKVPLVKVDAAELSAAERAAEQAEQNYQQGLGTALECAEARLTLVRLQRPLWWSEVSAKIQRCELFNAARKIRNIIEKQHEEQLVSDERLYRARLDDAWMRVLSLAGGRAPDVYDDKLKWAAELLEKLETLVLDGVDKGQYDQVDVLLVQAAQGEVKIASNRWNAGARSTALRELQQTYDALAELMAAREKQGFCEADAAESAREAARLFRREVCLEAKDNSPERVAALKECCDTFESLIPLIQQKSERVKNLGYDAKHASRHLERMRGDYAAACKMLKK